MHRFSQSKQIKSVNQWRIKMQSIIYIETERLILRQWQPSDTVTYGAMNTDQYVMEFFPSILTAEESISHINRMSIHLEERGYGLFAIERKDNHAFIGFTGLWHPTFEASFTPCTEIGWRISKENWNQGFATEAAKACLVFGFEQLSLKEIYSFTSIHNKRSELVMKKIGMQKTGEFDHPNLEKGHFLQKHILYKIVQ